MYAQVKYRQGGAGLLVNENAADLHREVVNRWAMPPDTAKLECAEGRLLLNGRDVEAVEFYYF